MIQTIIAPSMHRAKQLEKLGANPLARSLTLENFMQAYYERYGDRRIITMEEATSIMTSLFVSQTREHFDYITPQSDAMDQIASFIIDIKRNTVAIEAFVFSSKKEHELSLLFADYQEFLKQYSLWDNADRDNFIFESIGFNPENLNVFGEIIVDDFEQNGIHFETSKTQSKLLDALRLNGVSMGQKSLDDNRANFYEPSPAPFGIFDEVACALKIARKLLDENVNSDDILIVTPSIDEYAPIFETLFASYGLKGYSSKGIPLHTLLPILKNNESENELLVLARNKKNQIKSDIEKQSKILLSMGVTYDSSRAYEKAIKSARIKSRTKEGLQITEPNQLLSLNSVKHLIFVGTDMGHFPPLSKESFLASTLQKETLLHANSVYQSSYNHYFQMKAIAQNIYIVTATYKGKTKLARSHIVTEKCTPFEIGDILAPHELSKVGKRPEDASIDTYLAQIALSQSPYDGYDAGGYDVKTLSASQLGSYAMCPRRYFFDRVLKISAPGKAEEGLEASDKGTIMHKCFELFAIDAKAGKLTIGNEVDVLIRDHMHNKALIAYEWFMQENTVVENIHHRLYFHELTRGLLEGNDGQGVLINFLDFITQNHNTINGFRESEFEMEFRLDEGFNAVANDQPYFIKGFIDRIDIRANEIRIVDYKSKKAKGLDKAKLQQMSDLKDMQLALYILYARRAFGDKNIESYLQTFKSENIHAEFAKAATFEIDKEGAYLHYDEAFEQSLIERIAAIKVSMAEGDFHYEDSDKKHCEYCNFAVMCR